MPKIINLLFACSLLCSPLLSASEEKVYTFGVIPQFDPRHINKTWSPILAELEKRTGLKFMLRGSATIPSFEQEFIAGYFYFAYINPLSSYSFARQSTLCAAG